MTEQEWHKNTRENLIRKLKNDDVRIESSHTKGPNMELFRNIKKRENCLSDADIIVIDSDNKVKKIIETESEINPKKIIGIVIGTHLCTICMRSDERFLLDPGSISLEIYYRRPHERSKKTLKLEVLKTPLDTIIKNGIDGCLSDFDLKQY